MVIDNDIAGGGLLGYGLDHLLLALFNRTTSIIVLGWHDFDRYDTIFQCDN
jgi:hypothetical protein